MEVVPMFATDDDVIVEWRAVTVGLLDDLLVEVNNMLGLSGPHKLNLAQMLEAGSWKVRNPTSTFSANEANMFDREAEKSQKCRDPIPRSHLS